MQKLSKFIYLQFFLYTVLIVFFLGILNTNELLAQSPIRCGHLNEACCNLAGSEPNSCQTGLKCENNKCVPDGSTGTPPIRGGVAGAAFPEIKYPCDGDGLSPEFHSLRPYQAAFCGDANKAAYCSNDLKFVETFDVTGRNDCVARGEEGTFTCHPDLTVGPHTLIVELDDSMFPIMGNTEEVKNGNGGTEVFDDATKVNEYASWYLSGVNNRAEYGVGTTDQTINYSGPVQKLLPKVIQEAERIKTIDTAKTLKSFTDDVTQDEVKDKPINHNQIVACSKKEWWLFGPVTPVPCYSTFLDTEYRLLEWDRTGLGVARDATVFLGKLIGIVPGITADVVSEALASAWDNRKPPLPWDNGTDKPFESQVKYQKAYNEWQGKSCVIIPIVNKLICLDLDPTDIFVNSEWAEMYNYIPLSNTTDKKGAERVLDVQPHPSGGTAIEGFSYGEVRSAPLYFAHTQEVKELSELVSKTYNPLECTEVDGVKTCEPLKNDRDYKTVEKNNCSVVNVRVNKGDNLFPGDPDEIQVPAVSYTITEAQCVEHYRYEEWCNDAQHPNRCSPDECCEKPRGNSIKCTAVVGITLKTQTKTPNANEIFDSTVAGKGSIFRKIFPKVGVGAPVSCIADIPTVTDVTYTGTNTLQGGGSEFSVVRYPEDGAGDNPQLTFPHVGSVYEYFLKGIQTALRPKGYGEPIVSGSECLLVECGKLPELPSATGSCSLGSYSSRVGELPPKLIEIINAAAETYKTPPDLILAVMFGEGQFNTPSTGGGTGEEGGLPWSDYNVENWATCTQVPNCNDGPGDDGFMGFYDTEWENIAEAIKPDLIALDPKRTGTPSRCNLLDAIYGLAWNLHDSADGGGGMPPMCFGINLGNGIPQSCSWDDKQIAAAIQVAENGYQPGCFTKDNSCAEGGGPDAACPTGGDTCEKIDSRWNTIGYSGPSHFGCLYDVSHGN